MFNVNLFQFAFSLLPVRLSTFFFFNNFIGDLDFDFCETSFQVLSLFFYRIAFFFL